MPATDSDAYGTLAPAWLDRAVIGTTCRLPCNWLGQKLAILLRKIVMMRLEHPAGALDVELDPARERDDAAGVDVKALARGELALDHGAARVHEHEAVALELLHDEALAAEEARENLLLEEDAELNAARAAEEAVLLADQRAAYLGEPTTEIRPTSH